MADTKTIAPKEGPGTQFWNWLTETQIWTSVFRHGRPDSDRNRVLVMLSNVFLHLHPVRIRKSGVKLRYTWCMGGLSFFLFLVLHKGQLREAGTHQELLAQRGIYFRLFELQYRTGTGTETGKSKDLSSILTSKDPHFQRFLDPQIQVS